MFPHQMYKQLSEQYCAIVLCTLGLAIVLGWPLQVWNDQAPGVLGIIPTYCVIGSEQPEVLEPVVDR